MGHKKGKATMPASIGAAQKGNSGEGPASHSHVSRPHMPPRPNELGSIDLPRNLSPDSQIVFAEDSSADGPPIIVPSPVFALRMATFNAIGFCVTTAGTTFLDSRLVNCVRFRGGRHYPFAYSICWYSISVFLLVYLLILWPRHKILRLFLPPLAVLVCTAAVLPNFPPIPHVALALWMLLYSMTTFGTLWVKLHPDREKGFNDPRIDPNARIEWIKASFGTWRALFTGSLLAYVALVVTWVSTNTKINEYVTRDPAELEFMAGMYMCGVAIYTAFVFGGPLYELYYKMRDTASLLLSVKRVTP
jgi:hypothetical protein